MLLYVNGDSFAAGSGLCDAEYVDNFEYYLTAKDKRYIYTDYIDHRSKCIENKRASANGDLFYSDLYAKERERSWSATLGKNIGAEVINSAEPGSSMEAILYRTLLDLIEMRKKDTVPDLVIIHITDPARITLLRDGRIANIYKNKFNWIESLLLARHSPDHKVTELQAAILQLQSEIELALKMVLEIMLIKSIVKEMTGKYPVFTTTTTYLKDTMSPILTVKSFDNLVEESGINTLSYDLTMSTHVLTGIDRLPCGHYSKEVNDRFALSIESYLRKNNVIVC